MNHSEPSAHGRVRRPALVVEPSVGNMLVLVPALQDLGFDVTVASTFLEAREQLHAPPGLLVASLRLGAYNGLHLVMRGRSARADMAAVVLSEFDDRVLQREAEQLRATFIVAPVGRQELQAAITRTLFEPVVPVGAPFERRQGERRGQPALQPAHDRRRTDRRTDPRARLLGLALH